MSDVHTRMLSKLKRLKPSVWPMVGDEAHEEQSSVRKLLRSARYACGFLL
jgi:hypothetical protein